MATTIKYLLTAFLLVATLIGTTQGVAAQSPTEAELVREFLLSLEANGWATINAFGEMILLLPEDSNLFLVYERYLPQGLKSAATNMGELHALISRHMDKIAGGSGAISYAIKNFRDWGGGNGGGNSGEGTGGNSDGGNSDAMQFSTAPAAGMLLTAGVLVLLLLVIFGRRPQMAQA